MNTTTNTRGVAMVTHQDAAGALDSLDDYARMGIGVDAHGPRGMLERYIAQQAALSAPEPAARGEGWADESRKYLAYQLTQMADGGPLAFCADTLRDAASWLTAPPAQPERVPDPETACAMWIKPTTTEAESNAFLAGARAMLAASPAPSEGGKGVEG